MSMHADAYRALKVLARRLAARPDEADDLLQEALLAVLGEARTDPGLAANRAFIAGIMRNKGRMLARGAARRRRRETGWAEGDVGGEAGLAEDFRPVLAGLPGALRVVLALALAGHSRREIAYLLRLTDTALRQRIRALKQRLSAEGVVMPRGLPGLAPGLAYGRLRAALRHGLDRHGGVFASHDPDGHIFFISRSRNL